MYHFLNFFFIFKRAVKHCSGNKTILLDLAPFSFVLCFSKENIMQLYYHPASPPSRAVLLLCQALNLQPELKVIDSSKGDNVTPEYLKVKLISYWAFKMSVINFFNTWELAFTDAKQVTASNDNLL